MADVPLNPSSVVVNGGIVNSANPIPVVGASAPIPGTDVYINPRVWVVDGAIVLTSNPIPLQVV